MTRKKRHREGGGIFQKICVGIFGIILVQGIPAQSDGSDNAGKNAAFFQHIAALTISREYNVAGSISDTSQQSFFNTIASKNFAAGLNFDGNANQLDDASSARQIALSSDSPQSSQSSLENETSQPMTVEGVIALNGSETERETIDVIESIAEIINSTANLNNFLLLEGSNVNFENAVQPDGENSLQLLAYAPADTNENVNALLSPIFGSASKYPTDQEVKESHEWINGNLPISVLTESEQKCLAEAIYFEARSESVEGQVAVAQVVLNRILDPRYPDTICEVVYQNQHRLNQCQFSFACDGMSESVDSISAWRKAQKVAENVTDGISHLNSVGKSTHYHAAYVNPHWANSMHREVKIGQHIFYTTNLDG